MKKIVRFLIWLFPWLSYDYRRRIKPRRKCPACGAVKKHKMQFDPEQGKVVMTCVCCEANWGYDPVVNPAKWTKPTEGE